MSIPCVYVAGAYRAPDGDLVTVQDNMRRGLALGVAALEAGYAVFVPWLDFELTLHTSRPIPSRVMLAHSLAWMERADAVLVQPVRVGSSIGTQAELVRAKELGIPIAYSLEELAKLVQGKAKDGTD
jgi:hypothetical protein